MKDKSLNWVGGEVGWVVWDWGRVCVLILAEILLMNVRLLAWCSELC